MALPISPIVRRHSTVQKRASFKDVRDIQPGLKLALRAANESAAAAAASSSSSRSSSIAIATTSTQSATHSSPSTNVASSSSANRVASTTSTTSSATTSTSTSATHPDAATTSSTSTSSSSVSSSSSQVSSASTVPGTTFIAGPFATPTAITTYIPPTVITTTSSVPTTSPSTTSAPKSFLANTGAAAAVFTAVGLVGLALLIMAISFLLKRHRRRAQPQDDDEYFEKIVAPHSYDSSGATGSRGLASLDPVHLSHANDMYNTQGGGNYAYTPQDYGIEYPPGTSYTSSQEHANAYNTPGIRGPDSQAALDPFDDPFGSRVPSRVAAANISNPRGPYEPSDPYY